jgi:hypothetical protein
MHSSALGGADGLAEFSGAARGWTLTPARYSPMVLGLPAELLFLLLIAFLRLTPTFFLAVVSGSRA